MSSRSHDFRDKSLSPAQQAAQEESVEAALVAMAIALRDDEPICYDGPEGIFEDYYFGDAPDYAGHDWDHGEWFESQEYEKDYWLQYEADLDADAGLQETDPDYDLQVADGSFDLLPQSFIRGHPGLEDEF